MKLKRCTIRRKVVCFFILIVGFYGCSAVTGTKESTVYPSWEEGKQQILSWASSEKRKVDEGKLKNSEYWKGFYRRSIALRPDLDDFLCYASEMIKISRIFEEGKITKEQFDNKYLDLVAILSREEDRRAKMLNLSRMNIYGNYETEPFYFYRSSLFLGYINDLRKKLNEAGPQFSSNNCAFFGDTIQCTPQNPPF